MASFLRVMKCNDNKTSEPTKPFALSTGITYSVGLTDIERFRKPRLDTLCVGVSGWNCYEKSSARSATDRGGKSRLPPNSYSTLIHRAAGVIDRFATELQPYRPPSPQF